MLCIYKGFIAVDAIRTPSMDMKVSGRGVDLPTKCLYHRDGHVDVRATDQSALNGNI